MLSKVIPILLFALPLAAADPPEEKPKAYQVTNIAVRLFYEETGRLDARDIASSDFALWNTIIGEGSADAPSSTSLVLVRIEGPSFLSGTKGEVRVRITHEKREVVSQKVALDTFFADGTQLNLPFVAFGTGCGTLVVEASVHTPTGTHRKTRTDAFPCGE